MLVYYELTGTLETLSPLHIGTGDDGEIVDQPLLRDGLNRLIIPGTSIAGVIDNEVGLTKDLALGQPSAITVCDSTALSDPRLEITNRTSIDRRTGSAASHQLHSQELIPTGCTFSFRASTEPLEETTATSILNQLQHMRELLTSGNVALGKGVSNGNGLVKLKDAQLTKHELSVSGLLKSLKASKGGTRVPSRSDAEIEADFSAVSQLNVTIPFCAEGALYNGVSTLNKVVDIIPLTRECITMQRKRELEEVRFLLPATSIKGVFRSRAEFIARTVTHTAVHEDFLRQITESGLNAVNYLFGFAKPRNNEAQRGALTFFDVESEDSIKRDNYYEMVSLSKSREEDADLEELLDRLAVVNGQLERNRDACGNSSHIDYVARTAIDRFTANALNGALFSILEPHVSWKPMRISLDLDFLKKVTGCKEEEVNNDFCATIALFILLLIDLSDGLLRFGARTTDGAGGVEVTREKIELYETGDPAKSILTSLGLEKHLFDGSLQSALQSERFVTYLNTAWQKAIEGANNE